MTTGLIETTDALILHEDADAEQFLEVLNQVAFLTEEFKRVKDKLNAQLLEYLTANKYTSAKNTLNGYYAGYPPKYKLRLKKAEMFERMIDKAGGDIEALSELLAGSNPFKPGAVRTLVEGDFDELYETTWSAERKFSKAWKPEPKEIKE